MKKEQKAEIKKSISWRAAEYESVAKGASWYFVTILAIVVLVVIALWQKNFFFAIFMALAGVLVVFFSRRRPEVLEFKVDERGVGIGKQFYEYDRLEDFALRNRPGRLDEIILRKKTPVNPYVKVPIDSKLAGEAKKILREKLPEVEHKESLIDFFAEWVGF